VGVGLNPAERRHDDLGDPAAGTGEQLDLERPQSVLGAPEREE
jgi:hypothetical protein